MTCNYCAFEDKRRRLKGEKRKVLLKPTNTAIEVWSYKLDSWGNKTDERDENIGYMALTMHCSCGED